MTQTSGNLLHMTEAEYQLYLTKRPDVHPTQELRLKVITLESLYGTPDETPYSKWGNKPTEIDGYTFDSNLEASRYAVLKLWAKHKIIYRLSCQHDNKKAHTWVLLEGMQLPNGTKQRAIRYIDDFQYIQADTGLLIVEDVKGRETAEFLQKAKLFRSRFPDVHFFVNHSIRGWYSA